ncbi:MAG: DUF308 domain-containing protein [Synergistaceae bacterium]|nr:DUF308 domain-containing protein [Synergistaceae bacterium]
MRDFRINCFITGAIMLVLGGFAFSRPVEALVTVGFFMGLGLIASGINYFSAFYFFGLKRFILLGLLDFVAGLYMAFQPGAAALVIPFVVGLWLVSVGFSRVGMSLWLGGARVRGWWLMLLHGVVLVVLGGVMFMSPLNVSLSVMFMMIMAGTLAVMGVLTILEGCIMCRQ